MNVELSENAARMAEVLVERERFASVGDALEYGLMAIEQLDAEAEDLLGDKTAEWWAELNQSIDEARADLAAGRGIPVTGELFEDIKRNARARAAAGKLNT